MIKAFIFDLDGTIVDTEPLFTKVWEQLGHRYGKRYTPEIKQNVMAHKAILAVQKVLQAWELDEDPDKILAEIEPVYLGLVRREIRTMHGLDQLFTTLSDLNIRKALSTSSSRKWVDTIFDKLDLHRHFEHVTAAEDVVTGKPDPEAFLLPIKHFGLEPNECAVVEDSIHGIQAAKKAGAIAIAIPSEFMPDADFSQADYVLTSLADISKEFIMSLDHENSRTLKKPKSRKI